MPIPAILRDYLDEHKLRTREEGLVFGTSATHPFTATNVRRRAQTAWAKANKADPKAKLVPIGLHECRHTYVTLMFEAGVPLERIGDYVGHSGTYMTNRYRHLLDGHEAQAAALLDAFLERADTKARLAQL